MLLNDFSIFLTLLLLLGVSGFFTAAEIGLLGMSRYRAQQWSSSPTPAGRALAWLLAHPAIMLGTILIAITASNYIAEAVAASWVIERLGREYLWIAIVGISTLVILFAEVAPALYAAANADRIARFAAVPVRLASVVLGPPAWLVSTIGRMVGGKGWPRADLVTLEELKALVSMESEQAELEEEEKEMLHSIFEFADKVARDVMVPKQNIIAIPDSTTVREAALAAGRRRISRLPIFHNNIDHIIGIAFAKDLLLPLKEGRGEGPVTRTMRNYFTVPEGRQVSELLAEFRRRKQTLAIVVDDHGQMIGLITMEDLLEEIVGDIFDEYDLATPAVERIGDAVVVDGRMSLEEASELIGAALPRGRYTTVAGLFLNRFGTVPREGENVEVDGFSFTAVRMDGSRIARVRISPAPAEEEA